MFDEELITWSADGGDHLFHRPGSLFGRKLCARFFAFEHPQYDRRFLHSNCSTCMQERSIRLHAEWRNRSSFELLVSCCLPDLHEQRAIAAALSDVDALLAALDKLIAKKRAIKQAAMQELLTGRTRLPGFGGEWETRRLGDIGPFWKGRGIKRDDVSDDEVPCIRYGELYTRYHNYVIRPVSRIPEAVARTALPIKWGDFCSPDQARRKRRSAVARPIWTMSTAFAGGEIVELDAMRAELDLPWPASEPSLGGQLQKASLGQGDAVVHISAGNLARVEV